MSAYMICDVAVHNREALIDYLNLAEGTVEQYSGRYLAQAGQISILEGDWDPQTIVVVEFPNLKTAKDWYNSESYAPALAINPKAMIRSMIVVEGLQ